MGIDFSHRNLWEGGESQKEAALHVGSPTELQETPEEFVSLGKERNPLDFFKDIEPTSGLGSFGEV